MKVLFISRELYPSQRMGGIGSYVALLSKALVKHGHTVVIIAASDNVFKGSANNDSGVHVVRLKGGDFFVGKSFIAKSYNKFRSVFHYDSYRRKVDRTIRELNDIYDFDLVELSDYGNEGKYW